MKQNKKGFTLVELLAVIVILAIIALIATPIILGVIDDAKKGAAKSSLIGYIDALEKSAITKLIDDNSYNVASKTFTISENGSSVTDSSTPAVTLKVDVKGDAPTGGTITYDANGSVSQVADVKLNGYTCAGSTIDTISCDSK